MNLTPTLKCVVWTHAPLLKVFAWILESEIIITILRLDTVDIACQRIQSRYLQILMTCRRISSVPSWRLTGPGRTILPGVFWKKPDTLDLLLIGVRPDYQNRGVNSLLFVDLFQNYRKLGFKYAETNANLETNAKVQAMWVPFEKELHKRRWVFGKEI